MEDLLESMCPCYNNMDAIFGEKGNVTPFGILDSGIGPKDASEDGSNGDTTDGHCHSVIDMMDHGSSIEGNQRIFVEDPEEVDSVVEGQIDQELNEDDESVPRPLTPNTYDEPPPPSSGAFPNAPANQPSSTGAVAKKPSHQLSNTHPARHQPKKKAITLDSSSDDETGTTSTPQVTQGPSGRAPARSTLARRPLDPLPSIDPSHVHGRENKHALASAIQQGNEAKLLLLNKANEWRQEMETSRLQAELEARNSSLTWDKEKYYLNRQDQHDN
ncbi:hypothetical protein DFH28DRAFT_1137111 [Melampsora americana]|nr:hypothetical protein DFH28DRAFT_1137111 [Melampsora americana]